jgi:predicted glutamine amidotransferase
MCGIIGYSGKEKPNKMWLKLMGLFNDSRGGQGVGYSTNGNIYKSIFPDEFKGYFQKNDLKFTGKNNTCIMHTRRASIGGKAFDNTHPFEIKGKLIGVHNGTVKNITELKNDLKEQHFDINDMKINSMGTDSEKIFYMLSVTGTKNLSVLEKYEGGAALMWYNPKNMNELMVFKGGNKNNFEDRPLFFLRDEDHSFIYLSSMIEPLKIIQAENPDFLVGSVPINKLMTLQSGKFVKSVEVKREELKKPIPFHNSRGGQHHGGYGQYDSYDTDEFQEKWKGENPNNTIIHKNETLKDHFRKPVKSKKYQALTRREKKALKRLEGGSFTLDLQKFANPGKNRLYIDGLKYKLNGAVISGFYGVNDETLETYFICSLYEIDEHAVEHWAKDGFGEEYFAFYNGNMLSTYWNEFIDFTDQLVNTSNLTFMDARETAQYFDQWFSDLSGNLIYEPSGELLNARIESNLVTFNFSCNAGKIVALQCLQAEAITESTKQIEEDAKKAVEAKKAKEQEEKSQEQITLDFNQAEEEAKNKENNTALNTAYNSLVSDEFLRDTTTAFSILTDLKAEHEPGEDFSEDAKLEFHKLGAALATYSNFEYLKETV